MNPIMNNKVLIYLIYLEGIVRVPVVVEPVELVELLHLLDSTVVHLIGGFKRTLPLVSPVLKHLKFKKPIITSDSFENLH